MTKQQTLELLMLLSALESWSFSVGARMPDYLHEKIADAIENLTNNLIEDKDPTRTLEQHYQDVLDKT